MDSLKFVLCILCLLLLQGWITHQASYTNDNSLRQTYTSEIVLLDVNMTEMVNTHRLRNKDLPEECRSDICLGDEINNYNLQGYVSWPNTRIGLRRYVKCPDPYDEVVYASRSCLPLDEYSVTWSRLNVSDCPEASTQAMREWKEEFVTAPSAVNMSSDIKPTTIQDEGYRTFNGGTDMYGLYITHHVLRVVSLVCLVITVASFLTCRKARRGTTTYILLNLCFTLIILILFFYISESVIRSKIGCRASNLMRTYLVFVVLLWNLSEAVNMYLMIVKVFNSHVSKFTRKAAVFAWGVPLIPVTIMLSISLKAFDGVYINCKFSCNDMAKPFLNYGFLLPIALIMLINFIIFIMICKVLCSRDQLPTQGKKRTLRDRLISVVALLVLLGLPWFFSKFALIEPNGNKGLQILEEFFNVLFVVLISSQGLFIFLYHCTRNRHIRSHWKATFSSICSLCNRCRQDAANSMFQMASPSTTSTVTAETDTSKI